MSKTFKYELYSYDVWGNEEEGYSVNDTFKRGIIELENDDDGEIIRELKSMGFLASSAETINFEIEGESDYTIYINGKNDNYPYCELRRIKGDM